MASAASVDDLRPGDHACLTYSDAEERLDIVAAFVRDGLCAGQRVICLTDPSNPAALSLPPGRAMAVLCQRLVREVLDLVGVTEQPAVRVRLAHGRP